MPTAVYTVGLHCLHEPVHLGCLALSVLIIGVALPISLLVCLVEGEHPRRGELEINIGHLRSALRVLIVLLDVAELAHVAQLHEVGDVAILVIDGHHLQAGVIAGLPAIEQHGVAIRQRLGSSDVVSAVIDISVKEKLCHGQEFECLVFVQVDHVNSKLPHVIDDVEVAHIESHCGEEAQVRFFGRCGCRCCLLRSIGACAIGIACHERHRSNSHHQDKILHFHIIKIISRIIGAK